MNLCMMTDCLITPEWLHATLASIFGANLTGLWIGEDMIVDGSSNVTSWPGRVGATFANIGPGYRTGTSASGHRASTAGTSVIQGLILPSTISEKTCFAVATCPALPFTAGTTPIIFSSASTGILYGEGGYSRLASVAGATFYIDGLPTREVTSGSHVFQCDLGSADTGRLVTGGYSSSVTYNWPAPISCLVAVSSTPTALQRTQATIALKTYYGIAITPQEGLARDLLSVFGTSLNHLYIGEDQVLSGTDITSWPGRVGATLVPTTSGQYMSSTTLGGRAACQAADTSIVRSLRDSTLLSVQHSFAVAQTLSALVESGLVRGGSSTTQEMQAFGWYTHAGIDTHYTDGVNTGVAATTNNIAVYEGQLRSPATDTLYVGGLLDAARSWTKPIALVGTNSVTPTAYQRAEATIILKRYYGLTVTDADLLSRDLALVLGSKLIGLYLGEDMILSGTDVTSWPGRVGTKLTPYTAGSYRKVSTIDGRSGSTTTDQVAIRALTTSAVALASALFVIEGRSSVAQGTMLQTDGSPYNLAMADTAGVLVANGIPHYINGVASEIMPVGLHVLECQASGASQSPIIGGSSVAGRNWQNSLCAAILLNAALTPYERLQVNALLRAYYSLSISTQEQSEINKAASIPVTGATVLAPLSATWRNYGSVGNAFSLAGAPTVGSSGATFDGTDDAAYLSSGYSGDFTLTARIKCNTVGGGSALAPIGVMQLAIGETGSGYGWGVDAGRTYWECNPINVTRVATTIVPDTNYHTHTIRMSGGTVYYYIDGVLRSSYALGGIGKGTMSLGAVIATNGVIGYFISSVIKNVALYHSALSSTDQALVEAWAAT